MRAITYDAPFAQTCRRGITGSVEVDDLVVTADEMNECFVMERLGKAVLPRDRRLFVCAPAVKALHRRKGRSVLSNKGSPTCWAPRPPHPSS